MNGINASDMLASRISALDEQIARTKDEAVRASRIVAQMQLSTGKKKLKELTALKNALAEIQKEALKEEVSE